MYEKLALADGDRTRPGSYQSKHCSTENAVASRLCCAPHKGSKYQIRSFHVTDVKNFVAKNFVVVVVVGVIGVIGVVGVFVNRYSVVSLIVICHLLTR